MKKKERKKVRIKKLKWKSSKEETLWECKT